MIDRKEFQAEVRRALSAIDPQILAFEEGEFWMIRSAYEYMEYYALSHSLRNTAVALQLARGLHNGVYRKSSIIKNGVSYRLPYVIHCLQVSRMLTNLELPLEPEDLDILLAAALCHDMIEDIPFVDGGRELYTRYQLDPRVFQVVKLLTKRGDSTMEEEQAYFSGIESNPLALLIKLSDRGHNVEDLYNMSVEKVHEYVGETERFFLPMCAYGMEHYPELEKPIEVLQDKIFSLTLASRVLVDRCEERERELREELRKLQEENVQLRREYSLLWQD